MFPGPGVTVVAFEPSEGPVPPPIRVVGSSLEEMNDEDFRAFAKAAAAEYGHLETVAFERRIRDSGRLWSAMARGEPVPAPDGDG